MNEISNPPTEDFDKLPIERSLGYAAKQYAMRLGVILAIALITVSGILLIALLSSIYEPILLLFLILLSIQILLWLLSAATTRTKKKDLSFWFLQVVKRYFDIVLATTGLLFLGPFLIMIVLAIKIDSLGPVLSREEIFGQGLVKFYIFRFRTRYYVYSGGSQPTLGKSQFTKLGYFLHKYYFDNLPLFINVIAGDMSLIGPVPMKYEKAISLPNNWMRRFDMKPGIIGLRQISDDYRDNYDLDLKYIDEWSLILDVKILIKTVISTL